MEAEELRQIYEAYIAQAEECRRSINPMKNFFGMRDADVNHPAHKEFYNAVGDWTDRFLAGHPSAESMEQVLRLILFAAAEHEKSAAVWYFIAAQTNAKKIIPLMDQKALKPLYTEYKASYPRGRRLPLQNELAAILKKAAQ